MEKEASKKFSFSNSKLDIYTACGYKYYLNYIEGYQKDYTKSSLLFGRAIDKGVNYLLECKRDGVSPDLEIAYAHFYEEMDTWKGQNPLDYYSNELPEAVETKDPEELQILVWQNLLNRGKRMLDTYQTDIIPLFKRIIDIQVTKKIENKTGQVFHLIIDLIAEMQDGTVVLLDNKTSSKKYTKNSVVKSQQLSLYSEFFNNTHCGYIVLLKTPTAKGETTQVIIDEIPEEQAAKSFEHLESTIDSILAGNFEKNEKSCYLYGKPCEFWNLCKRNLTDGLIKRKGYA